MNLLSHAEGLRTCLGESSPKYQQCSRTCSRKCSRKCSRTCSRKYSSRRRSVSPASSPCVTALGRLVGQARRVFWARAFRSWFKHLSAGMARQRGVAKRCFAEGQSHGRRNYWRHGRSAMTQPSEHKKRQSCSRHPDCRRLRDRRSNRGCREGDGSIWIAAEARQLRRSAHQVGKQDHRGAVGPDATRWQLVAVGIENRERKLIRRTAGVHIRSERHGKFQQTSSIKRLPELIKEIRIGEHD